MKKTRASGGSAADIRCEVTVVLDLLKSHCCNVEVSGVNKETLHC